MSACKRTYATFCIYSRNPEIYSHLNNELGFEPTRTSHKGSLYGWYLSTQDKTDSIELVSHLELLLNILSIRKAAILNLNNTGYDLRIFCYWESKYGNGGPVLTPEIMLRLSQLNLELHFDIWFPATE